MKAVVGPVVQIDEGRIQAHLDEVVRSTVEETLNALLDAEADRLCGVRKCAGLRTLALRNEDSKALDLATRKCLPKSLRDYPKLPDDRRTTLN